MIKAYDIDGGVNLSGSSSHGNNPDDDEDEEGEDGNGSRNSSSGKNKNSYKHHVFVSGLAKDRGTGNLTPKGKQKSEHHRTKRGTPKGGSGIMGESEFQN